MQINNLDQYPTKICHSKLEDRSKEEIQKLQQEWDNILANSKRKGTGYENELVKKLIEAGFSNVKRAWGSDGRSLGLEPDVDIVAEDYFVHERRSFKVQAKRRKVIPKWLRMGNCDLVMFREDRGITFVMMTFDDWVRCLKDAP